MADNEPVETRAEVESAQHDSADVHAPTEAEEGSVSVDRPTTDGSANTADATRESAPAPRSPTVPNSGETNDSPVATAPDQAVNPGPPTEDGATTQPEPQMTASVSAPEVSTPLVTPTPTKRFTSMNINKKFLAKTAAGSPSTSNSAATPKTAAASAARPASVNPQLSSRLVTKKLTNIAPSASASGGWLRATPPTSLSSSPAPGDPPAVGPHSSVKPSVSLDVRPSLVSSGSALSLDSRSSAKASRDHSPVKAWATVSSTGDAGRNLQDFPTAAEAAADNTDSKRPGISAVQAAHPAVEAASHNTDTDARDSFRGMHLDPNAHHWDEMEDESNDFLGEVIDFGDGKTYTVPPEEGEAASGAPVNKETRLGDDYDRSWPRSHPLPSEPETTSRQTQGPPLRQGSGDGRVLFNERSNRLEPARGAHSTSGGAFHQHAPPFAHLPPRSGARRNSALSSSDRPRIGHGREPPPHTRDPPPHAAADGRTRRPSDARSSHSPTERRSSFLHDDDRSRAGLASLRGRDEQGFGMRRETSRDSRLSTGDRPSRGHQVPGHRVVSDPFHHVGVPGISETLAASNGPFADSPGAPPPNPLSPTQQAHPLPTAPGAPPGPPAVAALSEEREKFMKQAAERARRRKQEEEAAREEARERARKKAAELEALSKASLVTASPLIAMAGRSSGAVSPIPKSPLLKSPAATTSALPVAPEPSAKPKEATAPASAAATVSSWRSKPKPEPSTPSTLPADAPSQPVPSPVVDTAEQPSRSAVPPPTELGRAHHIEELGKADGPVEVLDFSEMGKLAGRRTSITSPTESHRRKRSVASDFLDEAPNRRPGQAPINAWNKDRSIVIWDKRSSIENHEESGRAGSFSNKNTSGFSRPANENSWAKPTASTGPGMSSMPSRSSFKEAPISALDDVMSRIKGVLTDMHAEDKPAAPFVGAPLSNGISNNSAPAPASSSASVPKAAQGVASRWIGTEANWRDGPSKKVQPPPEPQPTEPFATTHLARAEALFPTETTYIVRFGKSGVARSPMPKKQAALAKLPPMPVRWDILSWNPPIERMSTRTLSRDDMFFPKTYIRGVLSARVLLPPTGSSSEAQAKQSEAAASRARLIATADPKPTRSPTISTRPPPKSPAFMDNQWRKSVASPVTNALELQNNIGEAPNQLETTSRSPPPDHPSANGATSVNVTAPTVSGATKGPSKQYQGADVAFHRSLHEKRPSNPPAVSFTVSSELDNLSGTEANTESRPVLETDGSASLAVGAGVDAPTQSNEDMNDEKAITGKITQSPTPNSSILLTPPVKVTTPWQGPNPRLPDADYLKSVWQNPSPKTTATENSLRGLADDFPSSIPHSVQEMKGEDEERKADQTGAPVPPRAPPHNAHRNFQQVPTSPAPAHMPGYPNHMPGPARPVPVASFSLPPPAPPQLAPQPTPYSPYIHPVAPSLMYTMPPSRIAPSPAPGGQMWVQGQAYGRPSPPAVMYPGQQGHAMSYPSPASQLPPAMQKPHGGMNGNHGHPMTSPAMSHGHPMHMGSPAMAHVAHMGSPALGHASPHMPGGPQHMYPGMGSPGGLGLGANMPYGAQRPAPMMQQSPMQGPAPNGYHMMPGGSYGPAGYGRGAMRSPSDGMPHHMALPHPQHAPVSPGTYHPGPYGRTW